MDETRTFFCWYFIWQGNRSSGECCLNRVKMKFSTISDGIFIWLMFCHGNTFAVAVQTYSLTQIFYIVSNFFLFHSLWWWNFFFLSQLSMVRLLFVLVQCIYTNCSTNCVHFFLRMPRDCVSLHGCKKPMPYEQCESSEGVQYIQCDNGNTHNYSCRSTVTLSRNYKLLFVSDMTQFQNSSLKTLIKMQRIRLLAFRNDASLCIFLLRPIRQISNNFDYWNQSLSIDQLVTYRHKQLNLISI